MLKGKTAIITGASNGIGREIAFMLAQEGAELVINYANDTESAQYVLENVRKKGAQAILARADVGRIEEVRKLSDLALQTFGKIDILVNNAGVFINNDFLGTSEEDFDRTMDVIVKGAFFLTQAVARSMVDRGIRGRIINISSAATTLLRGMPVDYCAAKSAVNTLTRALSAELGKYGITVNGILPGPIPTKLNKFQFDDPVMRETLLQATTLKEYGDAAYIANAARYFLTEDAKWTTGALLHVDGGATV